MDSSDDFKEVQSALANCSRPDLPPIHLEQCERGSSLQRNLGLAHVQHPVVVFPDDDSILFEDAAEKLLSVYESDTNNSVAAVCGVESSRPPSDFPVNVPAYKMTRKDKILQRFGGKRTVVENALFPDPIRILSRRFFPIHPVPEHLVAQGVLPVEWMTGFRMSFRTEIIRKVLFDTAFSRYSLFEDREASLGAWKFGAVVAAPGSRVFHYRCPERRDDGRRMGATQILNMAYIVAKHSGPRDPARHALRRFARYKLLLYRLSARDDFGRDRFAAAQAAFNEIGPFRDVSPNAVADLYSKCLSRALSSVPLPR